MQSPRRIAAAVGRMLMLMTWENSPDVPAISTWSNFSQIQVKSDLPHNCSKNCGNFWPVMGYWNFLGSFIIFLIFRQCIYNIVFIYTHVEAKERRVNTTALWMTTIRKSQKLR